MSPVGLEPPEPTQAARRFPSADIRNEHCCHARCPDAVCAVHVAPPSAEVKLAIVIWRNMLIPGLTERQFEKRNRSTPWRTGMLTEYRRGRRFVVD